MSSLGLFDTSDFLAHKAAYQEPINTATDTQGRAATDPRHAGGGRVPSGGDAATLMKKGCMRGRVTGQGSWCTQQAYTLPAHYIRSKSSKSLGLHLQRLGSLASWHQVPCPWLQQRHVMLLLPLMMIMMMLLMIMVIILMTTSCAL